MSATISTLTPRASVAELTRLRTENRRLTLICSQLRLLLANVGVNLAAMQQHMDAVRAAVELGGLASDSNTDEPGTTD